MHYAKNKSDSEGRNGEREKKEIENKEQLRVFLINSMDRHLHTLTLSQ